ncbi:head decoration protein [Tranquillimonas rosea]|uniref:head decoration protein n=1 Tax=Tranquillimonas rosea TaxID=641238 RepID=UPI003BACF5F5
MPTLNEGKTPGDFLLYETPSAYCRDEITVAAGADLEPGTVLGQVTASGKYVASDQGAADGSETPAAVLLTRASSASADVEGAIALVRGPAQVRRGGLVFDDSWSTETLRDSACASLETAGIVAIST